MRFEQIVEGYHTKDGREITFTVGENKERQDSAWVLYKIDAFIGREQVGYLKISFIPRKRWREFYPTLWHFAARTGWSIDREFLNSLPKNEKAWTPEQKVKLIREVFMHLGGFGGGDPSVVTTENIDQYWPRAVANLKYKKLKQYKADKAFHYDKPLVDYIQVGVGESEDRPKAEYKWQRKGIATAMYLYGARWVHQKFGLRLHASDLQQPEAKAAWDKMAQLGWVEPLKSGRRTLRPDIDADL